MTGKIINISYDTETKRLCTFEGDVNYPSNHHYWCGVDSFNAIGSENGEVSIKIEQKACFSLKEKREGQ